MLISVFYEEKVVKCEHHTEAQQKAFCRYIEEDVYKDDYVWETRVFGDAVWDYNQEGERYYEVKCQTVHQQSEKKIVVNNFVWRYVW